MQEGKLQDPFTLEIVKDTLLSIGDEMFHTLARTSMSPIIYEVLDFACGLTDNKGQLLTQGNGVAGFIGTLSYMVKDVLSRYSAKGDINQGDIFIINDPYGGGGTHLSDVGLVMPIFHENELIGFSANKAHWTEVGGKDVGSFTNDSTDIYQEGLQFPCIKIVDSGKVNEPLVEMIKSNVRFPDLSIGDMWAQIAALKIGEKRFNELYDKYSKETVAATVELLLDQGEKMARKSIMNLPNGVYTASNYIDGDGLGNGPFPIKVKVTITDDQFICDFRGSHPQVPGPVNGSYTTLVTDVRTVFLAITNPSQDVNDGVFRPLEVITDKGSIFSAERPAPVSNYWESGSSGGDLVWQALAPILPTRLTAGHFLSVCSVTLAGKHPDTEDDFLIVEPSVGGWGAGIGQDGARGQFCIGDGETYNIPVEVAEARYGVMVDSYRLRCDGKGAGEFIGGSGVIRSYRAMTDGQMATVTYGRHLYAPWGVDGGEEGSPNEFTVIKNNGEVDGPYGVYARYPLNTGDVLELRTGTGGGYGNPLMRDASKVQRDVKNGYFSISDAEAKFGVLLNPETLELVGETKERLQAREAGEQ
ncbi:hydantoinase B/oxoprolinase family protein [Sporosarcina sp. Te-1]|uniref:hydantoinase B/oxoprolinase family protein n=1 Tax=Sporosarcina sp. Te-1 TaxID=2818390 RepID=UPI001A9F93D3|nr:hydantoinase B/oxoprolinase family protein [Sporosarcina sp. Te-1]QTD40892.1 hydantoinase B/oxoprolinase family protein [Sporosarcina sp. Te-1]